MRVHQLSSGSRRVRVVTGAAIAAAAIVGVGLGVTTQGGAPVARGPRMAAAAAVIDRLGSVERPTDVLPAGIDLEELDETVDSTSIRLLGQDEVSSYWMGTKEGGDVCLIKDFVQDVSAVACTSPERLQQKGMAWSLAGDPASDGYRAIVALVLPDIAAPDEMRVNLVKTAAELPDRAEAEATRVWDEVSPNLLIADASALDPRLQYVIPFSEPSDESAVNAVGITFVFDPSTVPATKRLEKRSTD